MSSATCSARRCLLTYVRPSATNSDSSSSASSMPWNPAGRWRGGGSGAVGRLGGQISKWRRALSQPDHTPLHPLRSLQVPGPADLRRSRAPARAAPWLGRPTHPSAVAGARTAGAGGGTVHGWAAAEGCSTDSRVGLLPEGQAQCILEPQPVGTCSYRRRTRSRPTGSLTGGVPSSRLVCVCNGAPTFFAVNIEQHAVHGSA